MRLISSLILATLLLMPELAFAQNVPLAFTQRDCSISSLSGSSQSLSVANPNRKYLGIFNTGNASVYVNVTGGTAANTGISSITINSGNALIWKMPDGVSRNAITIIGTSGQPVTCTEGN